MTKLSLQYPFLRNCEMQALIQVMPDVQHSDQGVKYAAIINVKVLEEAGLPSAWLKSVKLDRVAIVGSMYEPSRKMY